MILCGSDIETPQDIKEYSLQPWRARSGEARIQSIALYSEDKCIREAVKQPSRRDLIGLLEECIDRKVVMTGWNLVFDTSWLCAYDLTIYLKRLRWLDGMLLLKRYDPWRSREEGGAGFGLKEAVRENWPNHPEYAIDATTIPTTEQEWKDLLKYNYKDAIYSALLTRIYWSALQKKEKIGAAIECGNIIDIAESYINGISINRTAIQPFADDIHKRIVENEQILGHDISVVRSPKKLANLIFKEWGYTPIKTTPGGGAATDKESLLKLAIQHSDDPRFGALMALRKCNTQGSKFVESVIKSTQYHGDNITRPEPMMSGTYSHRFTYASFQGSGKGRRQTGIALHQWERGKSARDVLQAPEGYLLAEFDFSGQEMRLMAIESQDKVMLNAFANGMDLHALMGAEIESLDYEFVRDCSSSDPRAKSARDLGKFANLSLQYRIGIDSIMSRALTQYGLQLWRSKAVRIKETYLAKYSGVPKYWKEAIRIANLDGYAFSRGGARVPLNNLNDYAQQQTAINFRIQGTGAEMKLLGIYECRNLFDENLKYGWDLHDALFMYVKDDEYALGKVKNVQSVLSNLPYKDAWGWDVPIPLPVDAKLGKTWGSLKGV